MGVEFGPQLKKEEALDQSLAGATPSERASVQRRFGARKGVRRRGAGNWMVVVDTASTLLTPPWLDGGSLFMFSIPRLAPIGIMGLFIICSSREGEKKRRAYIYTPRPTLRLSVDV